MKEIGVQPSGKSNQGIEQERLEILMFGLGRTQRFGINVLKVKEVIPCPSLNMLPESHPSVLGVAHLRGQTLTVVDLGQAIGGRPLANGTKTLDQGSVIVTEFNRVMTGFWVAEIDRIAIIDWANVQRPPKGSSHSSYITGVTRIDDQMVQILDVEKVLGETIMPLTVGTLSLSAEDIPESMRNKQLLVVDDSTMARKYTAQALDQLGLSYIMTSDGKEALELLQQWGDEGVAVTDQISMVISDIEMPEMDGYALTRNIRSNNALNGLYILLHTSLSGAINPEIAKEVGADAALSKFDAEDLTRAVVDALKSRA